MYANSRSAPVRRALSPWFFSCFRATLARLAARDFQALDQLAAWGDDHSRPAQCHRAGWGQPL